MIDVPGWGPLAACGPHLYWGRALRVVDGDTLVVRLELVLGASMQCRVRLLGVNTPELRGPERQAGLRSKAFAARALWKPAHGVAAEAQPRVLVWAQQADSFGRLLARVWYRDGWGITRELSQELIRWGEGVAA